MLLRHHSLLGLQGFHHCHRPNLGNLEFRHYHDHTDLFLYNRQISQVNRRFHRYHHQDRLGHLFRHCRGLQKMILLTYSRNLDSKTKRTYLQFDHTLHLNRPRLNPTKRHAFGVRIAMASLHSIRLDRLGLLTAPRLRREGPHQLTWFLLLHQMEEWISALAKCL